MKKYIALFLSLMLLAVTAEAQTTKEERKKLKKEKAEREYLKTKDLITADAYTFVALQATPLGGNRFFLNTIPNYIHVDQGEADIYLPYFGAVRMSNGYSAEGGIKFTGKLENYTVKFDDEKQRILLSFEIQRGHERHEFNFNMYKAGATSLVVASSRRNSIAYNGTITELELPLTN
ncbi:MAG: DUF4251 domain-containing protein [Flavobacteriaceae bacterium]